MFWSIFLNSLALILVILAVGWIADKLVHRHEKGDVDG
jgi:putative effector of murein hydrolase LrgA (UPF0299 family)